MATRQSLDENEFVAEPRSIDLRDYWLIVRRRWVLVLVLTVVGAIGGLGYAFSAGPTYSATSQVVVIAITQGPLSPPAQASLQVNMSTEQAVAQSPLVIAQAAGLLHVQPAVLQAASAKRLIVTVPANTLTTSNVLQITWQAASPQAAQAGADAFAKSYLSYRHRQLAGQIASLQTTLNAQVASLQKRIARLTGQLSATSSALPTHQTLVIRLNELTAQASTADNQLASLPTYTDTGGSFIGAARPLTPSGLGRKVVLALGVLLGLLLGVVLAFVRDSFDDRVRDPAQLEGKLAAATLAVLPPVENMPGESRGGSERLPTPAIATAASPDSRAAEAVRALRATLVAVAARRDLRTLLVVGADASVSSSRVVAELGVTLAESGRRVLLIAADMRGSSLPHIFDLPDSTGLSDLLVDGGDPKALTRQPKRAGGTPLPSAIGKRLAVLPSGAQLARALPILDSGAMLDLLQSQRDAYDFVVLDSPPATVAADVFSLAAHVDGVIVLAREARTRGRTVEDLRRRLDQVGALLIGGVFIGKGSVGRHRDRSGRPQPVANLSIAASERRPAGQQAARRPPPPATGPAPAIRDDEAAPGASGGLAKRPL
jgi:Mrp family chromosome partitioning ATPase/capsular polysaccharide biosynthesis protein